MLLFFNTDGSKFIDYGLQKGGVRKMGFAFIPFVVHTAARCLILPLGSIFVHASITAVDIGVQKEVIDSCSIPISPFSSVLTGCAPFFLIVNPAPFFRRSFWKQLSRINVPFFLFFFPNRLRDFCIASS
jgi:hypothetical protein